jgi:hypothetical protein
MSIHQITGCESGLRFRDAFDPAQLEIETEEYTKLAAALNTVGEQ